MTFIRPMTNDDLDFAVDQTLREGGATGRHMFEIYLAHDPDGCFIAEDFGQRVGMEPTNLGSRIGPWIALDLGTAQNLLTAARCAAGPGRTLTLGVPAPNNEAHDLLSATGFKATPSCRRMIRGTRAAQGQLNRIFAIAGGAVG